MDTQTKSILKFYLIATILTTLFLAVITELAHADLPDDQTIIHCGLGEARDQGMEGLTAVFEAIRNRGHLNGVYGCKASFKEPKWVWDMGRKAWEASETSNLVNGADHWHNVRREGETYWTVKMTKTVCIKDHCFYK